MQFLKTLFWVVIAAIVVIFSMRNWTPVQINLWGGLAADVKLPLLLLLAFVAGFLPCYLIAKAACWQLRRKLDAANRALDEMRGQLISRGERAAPSAPALPDDPSLFQP